MVKKRRTGPIADRFVEATLELIEEQGGSLQVNLREVARRVGCAHTNVYNYFEDFGELLWESMRRALDMYGEAMTEGLRDDILPIDYFRRLITNLIAFPQEHPGLYRFIGADRVNNNDYPQDILDTVLRLKKWLDDSILACAPGISPEDAKEACNIIYSYLDGECFNLINDRVVPGEDVPGRMLTYALRLFTLLTGYDGSAGADPQNYPRLVLRER
jgi:AcrR family transcriptional regulator